MTTIAVVCPTCQRVLALDAALPATCFGGITPEERATLSAAALEAHPKAHRDCVELEVVAPNGLDPEARLAEVERIYRPQLAALGGLTRR
jgi:hypothetical protein